MWEPGLLDLSLKQFFDVLKPGGILAIEDHRADPRPQVKDGRDGYVNTDVVVAAAKKAGFVLDAKSEINANPKDTKDHPFGVWTLPPTLSQGEKDRARYVAIGEADNYVLKFRKPK